MEDVVRNLASAGPSSLVLQELAKTRASASTDQLDSLSGPEFERLITRLLSQLGFRAEITKASGDGGVDIVGTLNQPLTGGRFLVQCKRYAPDPPIGAAVVREFYGAVSADKRAVKGILITTSAFTAQAREFAANLPIELIGREQLLALLETHGMLAEAPVGDVLTLLPASVQSMQKTLMGAVIEQRQIESPALRQGNKADGGQHKEVAEALPNAAGVAFRKPPDGKYWVSVP